MTFFPPVYLIACSHEFKNNTVEPRVRLSSNMLLLWQKKLVNQGFH